MLFLVNIHIVIGRFLGWSDCRDAMGIGVGLGGVGGILGGSRIIFSRSRLEILKDLHELGCSLWRHFGKEILESDGSRVGLDRGDCACSSILGRRVLVLILILVLRVRGVHQESSLDRPVVVVLIFGGCGGYFKAMDSLVCVAFDSCDFVEIFPPV